MSNVNNLFKFNMKISTILHDLSRLLKEEDIFADMIEQYGIDDFMDLCKENDVNILDFINQQYTKKTELTRYNQAHNTNFSNKELIKHLKSRLLALPHMDYDKIDEIKAMLNFIYYDNPNIFQDLKNRPYLDLHNELIVKYNNLSTQTIDN